MSPTVNGRSLSLIGPTSADAITCAPEAHLRGRTEETLVLVETGTAFRPGVPTQEAFRVLFPSKHMRFEPVEPWA